MAGSVTDAELQQLILKEIRCDRDPETQNAIGLFWELYAEKALVAPRLQYLYAKRHALDFRIGRLSDQVDMLLGTDRIEQQQEIDHLQAVRLTVQQEIGKIEGRARSIRVPAVGLIKARNSEPVPSDEPDPSNSVYRGDPRKPTGVSM
jgi:hypothetical protein